MSSFVQAQEIDKTEQKSREKANELFQEGNYVAAMPEYSHLLSLHKKDPFLNYRFGVCYLYADRRDTEAPIKYMKKAEGHDLAGNDKYLFYYYLGMAYHLNYKFIEAIDSYESFKQITPEKQMESFDLELSVDRLIEMAQNGLTLLDKIKDLYVFNKTDVDKRSFYRSYKFNDFGGKLLYKPSIFKTKIDKKKSDNSIVFFSDNNSIVFYSSYGDDKNNSRDIYYSVKNENNEWGEAQKLSEAINTPYDEDYPYLLQDGKTLYFSSKGHSSMGGYDIFKSVYDSLSGEWSEPKNIEFAINTPFDDILFVTDRFEQFAYFSSDRTSVNNTITVYKVRIDRRPKEILDVDFAINSVNVSALSVDSNYLNTIAMIKEKSKLDINANEDDFEQQIYVDEYKLQKFNLSRNISGNEVVDRTFSEIDSAKQSLNYVKAKRDAIYNLLTNKQVEFDDNPQNEKLKNEIDLLELMGNDLIETIADRETELDGLLNRAGYIQQMTSSQRVDSSLVLLIDLLENINEYEERNYTVMDEMTAQYIEEKDGYDVPSEQFLADYMMEEIDQLREKAQTLRKDAAKLDEGDEQVETILNEAFSLETQADEKERQANDLYAQAQAIKVYSASGDLADISVLLTQIDSEYDTGNYILAYNDTSSNEQNQNNNNNQNINTVNVPDIWPETLDYQDYTVEEQGLIINAVQNVNEIVELNKQNQDQIAALLLTSNHYIEKANIIESEMLVIKDKIDNTDNLDEKTALINEYNQLNTAYKEAVLKAQTSFNLYDAASENFVAGPDQLVLDNIFQEVLVKVDGHLYDEAQEKLNNFNTIKDDIVTVEEVLLDYNEEKQDEYNAAINKQENLIGDFESEKEKLNQINNDIAAIDKQIDDETNENKIQKLEAKKIKLIEKQQDVEMLINDIENTLADMSATTIAYENESTFINEIDKQTIQIDETAIASIDNSFVNKISTVVADYEANNIISDTYEYYPGLTEITTTQNDIVENIDTSSHNTEIETLIENNNTHLQNLNNYIAETNNNVEINEETANSTKIVVIESTIASVKIQISQIEEQIQESTTEEEKAILEQKLLKNNIQLENLLVQLAQYKQNQDVNNIPSNEENAQDVIYALYNQIKQTNNCIDSLYDVYKQATDENEKQLIQEQISEMQNTIVSNQNDANELIVMTSEKEYYEKMQKINNLLIVNNIFTEEDAQIENRMSVIIDYLHEGQEFNVLLNQTEDNKEKAEIYIQEIEVLNNAIKLQNYLLEDLANYVPENRVEVDTNLIAVNNNNNQVDNNQNNNNQTDVNNNNNQADNNNQNNQVDTNQTNINNNNNNQADANNNQNDTNVNDNNNIVFYNPDEQTPSEEMIPVDVELPSGLIFKVQFAALRRELSYTSFEGIEPIVGESSANGFIRYMAGSFTDINIAFDSRNTIRTMGYEDAFVVAYFNGERITVGEARTIINTPDVLATNNNQVAEETQLIKAEETSELFYTVQIGVYGTQRTSERLFGITPLIEDVMANGYYRYYSGFYNNKEEAIAWQNEIRAKGVPDAFVVAIHNGDKLSVGEADNLVEQGAAFYIPTQHTNDIEVDTVVVEEPKEEVFDPELIAYKLQLDTYTIDISIEQYYKIYYMNQTTRIQNHYIFAKNIFRVFLPNIASEYEYDRALKTYTPEDVQLFVLYGEKQISIKKAINIINSSSD
jgi:WD40 repeat protein